MSKEIEALKELKHWKETNNENGVVWLPMFAVEDIEKALEELKNYRKAFYTPLMKLLNELQLLESFKKFAKTHLVICVTDSGEEIYCDYKTYVEVTKKETTYPIVSEEEYNKIINYLKIN